jgi:hypothetical protein
MSSCAVAARPTSAARCEGQIGHRCPNWRKTRAGETICSELRFPAQSALLASMHRLVVVGTGIAALLTQASCRLEPPDASEFASASSSSSGSAGGLSSSEPPVNDSTDAIGSGEASTGTTDAIVTGDISTGTTGVIDTSETSSTDASTNASTSDTGTSDTGTSDTGPSCGNGMIEDPEECDDMGESATCDLDCTMRICGDGTFNATAGEECDEAGPTLACDSDCTFVECGDATLNTTAGEACDGLDLAGQTCQGLGFGGGTLLCDASCQLDVSGCATCGDGTASPGEPCDGGDLAGQTCQGLGFAGGNLFCSVACTFDTSNCYGCGDGSVDAGESCDGPNLAGQSCATLGFAGGTLACDAACSFDTSGCYECGDGTANSGEECDTFDLDGQSCATLGFGGGTLACDAACGFDTSGCYGCGDGTANPGEECDGADLGGGTCLTEGFSGGYLACNGACSYDASGCCISGTIIGFDNPADVAGWMVTDLIGTTAGWGLYSEAPQNQLGGPVPFPNAPVYGTDSNRVPPYPGGHAERSQVVTSVVEIPLEVTFSSWNVDEGSMPFDTKIIELSVDGGASWNMLVDCAVAQTQPFCTFVNDGRAPDDWDLVTLDTSPWAGQLGQLRFTYDTLDPCCSFERGWFIDDLSLCAAP